MADHSELKRLSEACGNLNWRFQQENWAEYAIRDDHGYIATMRVGSPKQAGPDPDREAKAKFLGALTPAAVLALIAENKRLESEAVYSAAGFDAAREEIARLKAEIAGLKTGYEAYEQVNAGLKAEVEKLRDDLEQNQYDANTWRNGEESVWIEVFNSDGDDPFISAISGQITVEQLALIQAEILEYRDDYFEKGSGLYVFRCAHYQAHYDNVGMTEPAHWETDFESYSAFPWEEEGAALAQGEQS